MNFIAYLEEEYENRVAKGYINDFKQFMNFLEDREIKVHETKKTDITEYILWLRENGTKETTINKKLSVVRKLFKYLRIQRVMLENPMEEIKQLKIYKEKKEISEEVKEILLKEAESKRDELILRLLIVEQLKPIEMIRMKFSDVDGKKGIIYTEKKALTITSETASMIDEFEGNQEEYVLKNQHGRELKESGIYFVLNRYLKRAGSDAKPQDFLKKSANSA